VYLGTGPVVRCFGVNDVLTVIRTVEGLVRFSIVGMIDRLLIVASYALNEILIPDVVFSQFNSRFFQHFALPGLLYA
jgi:hypothetical protein